MLETVRENLKYYRKKKNFSQETLSKKCNYDKTYVGKIERGDTNPSVEALLRIAEVLDIPSVKLFQSDVTSHPGDFQKQLRDPTDQVGGLFIDVFKSSPAICFLTNEEGEILQINESTKKFLKAEANVVIGQAIEELPLWSQSGLDPSIFVEMREMAVIGKQATRRVTLGYKGKTVDLQIQVSGAEINEGEEVFAIFQLFLVEETSDRTLIGDHFELLRA
ncbi:MAG: helix-turn-helix domain-containing protein [bacterium]